MDFTTMLKEEREIRQHYEEKKLEMENKLKRLKANERILLSWILLKSAPDTVLHPFKPNESWSEENITAMFRLFLTSDHNGYKKGRRRLLASLQEENIPIEAFIRRMGCIMFFCAEFANFYQQRRFIEDSDEKEVQNAAITSSIKELTDIDVMYRNMWKRFF